MPIRDATDLSRRTLGGGMTVLVAPTLEGEGFLAAFTERTGGTSEGRFSSLNLGFRSGDQPARVRANRRGLAEALGIDGFACASQVHGALLAEIDAGQLRAGFEDPEGAAPGADAMATSRAGVALAILTADCVPIALADPRRGRLAVVHAGWRGVSAGIVARTVTSFGGARDLVSAIGPAVGPDHYEVDPQVASAVAAGAGGRAALARRGARIFLDLAGTVEMVLRSLGLRRIDRCGACTACSTDRFFSYRAEGQTGRQALVAARRGDRP